MKPDKFHNLSIIVRSQQVIKKNRNKTVFNADIVYFEEEKKQNSTGYSIQ